MLSLSIRVLVTAASLGPVPEVESQGQGGPRRRHVLRPRPMPVTGDLEDGGQHDERRM
jgi:hypothetical protein